MKSWPGGSVVKPGFYWNRSDWQIVTVETEAAPLPGGAEGHFVKLPGPVVLALAPVLGLSLVMFVPVAGFAVVAAEAGRKAVRAVSRLARRRTA
jgi:hypothetical protein